MFKPIRISLAVAVLALTWSVQAQQKPAVYPAKNQSAAQQQKDDGECYTWAKGNTGVDPAALAAAPPPSTAPAPTGDRAKGAVKGAVVGGLVTGGDSHGAAAGAAVGMMAGGAKSRQKQQAAAQQSTQQQQQAMGNFYKAYGACMQGRGYSVK
jgi:hypothetical protein